MKRTNTVLLVALCVSVATGYSTVYGQACGPGKAEKAAVRAEFAAPLYDGIFNSYYAAQEGPAYQYFQNSGIQKSLAAWVQDELGYIKNPQWNLDSFARIEILDHDFKLCRPDEQLYTCTFSDEAGRGGYIIVIYDEDKPGFRSWGAVETKTWAYDLRPNWEEISAGLSQTNIDLTTATASRVYFFDREKKRADQVIRFTDEKEESYLYYLGG